MSDPITIVVQTTNTTIETVIPAAVVVETQVGSGPQGATGAAGADGADGVGVPVGGTAGQVLAKINSTNYNTQWVDQSGGGGGAVDSVNSQTGAVVLDADDISDAATTNKFTNSAGLAIIAATSGTNTGDNATNTQYSGLAASKQDVITGLTASGAELNILDGATLTTTELNYVDGVTSAIQTQLDGKAASLGVDDNYVTDAEKVKLGNLSGTNTGDQTSIVGITGTKAQFDTVITDGNILYVGDVTQYTDEMAQDSVGSMVDSSLVYVDATPLLQRAALTGDVTASAGSNTTAIANDVVTYAKMQNVSATDKLLGRSSSGAGDVEEIACTAAGRALIDDADTTAQRTTLGLGTLATQSGTFSGTSSGTNTGDQTSIVGITGTKAQFDTAVTDGNILYVGDAYAPGGTDVVVADGGTGVSTMTTAYAPVCAGTTATGALQVASTGLSTSGWVLTSNGASALPSFQAVSGGSGLTQPQVMAIASMRI